MRPRRCTTRACCLVLAVFCAWVAASRACRAAEKFDVLIRGGTVYDGSGKPPRRADVGIRADRIAAIGDLAGATAATVVDAENLAVSPGFINMLSWSTESLLADGRGQSEIRQGVTTQIMGEGWSMGPVNDAIKKRMKAEQGDFKYDIEWNTLGEYLYFLQRKGVSHNVASFLGATTVREYVLGLGNRKPTEEDLKRMRALVEREMRDGALGIGSALEYSPAYYADTDELIELCKVAAKYKGKYITHMRSEGERLLEGIDEVIRISREAKIPAEIYHFKAAGQRNWPKMDAAIGKVEAARREGLPITANMYGYTAGAAPLTACIPPWAMEGGEVAMRRRLRDPDSRKRILDYIRNRADWPNFYRNAGSPEKLMPISFKRDDLKPLQGKTLAEIAKSRGKDPVETLLDLLLEDESGIGTVYFITAEVNIRKIIPLPWVSFGSDEASQAPEGVFLKSMPHPRAYGNFARVLGKYVREEKLLPLEEAVRKMTSLPATNLGLDRRGLLSEGYFADVVVFDPKTIIDRATYEKPHQYAVGVRQVFVNGVQVLRDGEHTGTKPGRALSGPEGWLGDGHVSISSQGTMQMNQRTPLTRRDMLRTAVVAGGGMLAAASSAGADAPPAGKAGLPQVRPQDIGINPGRLQVAYDLMEKWTTGPDAPVPGGAIMVGRSGKAVAPRFFGRQGPEADAGPIRRDAMFYMASVTKPVIYLSGMLLVERGQLNLSDRVTRYVPEFTGGGKETAQVLHLFTHTSGLPDELPGNAELRRQHAPLKKFMEEGIRAELLFKPGTRFSYASTATILVADIVQRISGLSIREFVRREIVGPLGLKSTGLGSQGFARERIVGATVPDYQAGTDFSWNSRYWQEFGSPAGGLFSTPEDFAVICALMLGGGKWGGVRLLSPTAVRMMTSNRMNDLPDLPEPVRRTQPWGLGWRLNHLGMADSWGDLLSRQVFGHTGSAGNLVWMDPRTQGFCILFTNYLRARAPWRLVHLSNAVAGAFE